MMCVPEILSSRKFCCGLRWFDSELRAEFAESYPPPCGAITRRPLSVSRYFCLLLRGLSGMVISIRPTSKAGAR